MLLFTLAPVASAPRAALFTYASKSATRCARSGSAKAAGAAGAASVVGGTDALTSSAAAILKLAVAASTNKVIKNFFIINLSKGCWVWVLNCEFAFFFRPDPHCFFHAAHENFAIADLAGLGRPHNGRYGCLHLIIGEHQFNFNLWQEI